MTERETLKTIREGILSGKCSDGNLAWIVNLCDESLAESWAANPGNAAGLHDAMMKIYKLMTADCPADEVEIANICLRALTEPARNCDVMSRSICTKHFSTIYEGNRDGLCDVQTGREKNIHLYYIEFNKWLFAPAEKRKGENDGSI